MNKMTKPDYVLFDKDTTAIVFGNQPRSVQRMLDFDYLSKRTKPSVAAVVSPRGAKRGKMKVFMGKEEILIPTYRDLKTAAEGAS